MKCNELSVPTYEVSVSCGSYCYGGSAVFAPTSYPEHTEADDFVWVKGCDAAALQARLAEAERLLRYWTPDETMVKPEHSAEWDRTVKWLAVSASVGQEK